MTSPANIPLAPFVLNLAVKESPRQSVDVDSLLDAISQVESGNNDEAVGALGEVSRYQIRPELWKEVTILPLSLARFWPNARDVARKIIAQYEKEIPPGTGCDPVGLLARDWECGRHGLLTFGKAQSVQRIVNIYRSLISTHE